MIKVSFKRYKLVYLVLGVIILGCASYACVIKASYKDNSNELLTYTMDGLSSHWSNIELKFMEQNITEPKDLIIQSDIIVIAKLNHQPDYYSGVISQPLIITDVLKGDIEIGSEINLLESFYYNSELSKIMMHVGAIPCVENQEYLLFLTKQSAKYAKNEEHNYFLTSQTSFGKYNLSDIEVKLTKPLKYEDITYQSVLIAEDKEYLNQYIYYKEELINLLNLK